MRTAERSIEGAAPEQPHPLRDTRRAGLSKLILPAFLALLAAYCLYRSPWSASGLAVVPDEVEHAVGAQRLATLGRYDIAINGVAYPPRYPPGFSTLVLAPFYWLMPREPGAGILPVFLFGIVAALAAYAIGRRLAGAWGGVAGAIALLSYPGFIEWSRYVMTDGPVLALGLLCCTLYLGMRERRSNGGYLLAGLLVGLAFALRGLAAALLFPFVVDAVRRRVVALRHLTLLLVPTLLVAGATAAYNLATFGDVLRDGYHFWCPVPFDYGLAFSPTYLRENLHSLRVDGAVPTLLAAVIGAAVLLGRNPTQTRRALAFAALATGPVSAVHLFYVFPYARFHLLAIVLLRILAAAGLTTLIPAGVRRREWLLAAPIALALALVHRNDGPYPERRILAESIAQSTPADAAIVTDTDAVYLEPLALRGTRRRIVPFSRRAEYASKVVAYRLVPNPDPPPRSPADHRALGLLRGGAQEVFPWTVEEAPERLLNWVRSGVPAYLDTSTVPEGSSSYAWLGRWFHLVPVARSAWLRRMEPLPNEEATSGVARPQQKGD